MYNRARELNRAGNTAYDEGDHATARSLHQQALALVREIGYEPGIAHSLYELGLVAEAEGNDTAARSLYEESLLIARRIGNKELISRPLTALGVLSSRNMDYRTAQSMYEESLALGRELGDKHGIAIVLGNLANILNQQGQRADANIVRIEALELQRELGDEVGIVWSLEAFANMEMWANENDSGERAARLWGAVEALHSRVKFPLSLASNEQQRFDKQLADARARLSDPALKTAWVRGGNMSTDEAIDFALEGARAKKSLRNWGASRR